MANLAPYAAHPELSQGRKYNEPSPSRYRNEYQRDRDRIIHSTAFRRLEYKTQVFVNSEGDLFRTRLTHTLEVVQLSRTVARALQLNEDLTEAIALAHDLGHTPFGHAGQEILNYCLKNYGGFEHNLQSLRIVDELEEKYPPFRGLNLTYETREGILKHCPLKQAKTLGQLGNRFLNEEQPTPPGLEAQITNLCDEIAYLTHDLDDGLRAKLITIRQLREYKLFDEHYVAVHKQWPNLSQRRSIYATIRSMIGEQITNVIEISRDQLEAVQPKSIDEVRMLEEPLITFSAMLYEKQLELKQFLQTQLYQHYRVRRMGFRAQQIIRRLFDAFNNDPYLLPLEAQLEVQRLQAQLGGDAGRARAVADYIAGMTDRYAIAEYEQLFNPG
jgi:dGTPase